MYEEAATPDYSFSTKIRVPKNTYPVHTEHTLQFRVHVQWVPKTSSALHAQDWPSMHTYMYTHNIKVVVAQKLLV